MTQPIPFGKYYLLERVNVGGMAEVFKAKATGVEGFERLVAVKRILPNIAEDEEFITMFVDEAKIAVQLNHANIAQIFDLGKVGDSYFIALEYVQGKDLRAIFNRCRSRGEPLPVPLACFSIMKVCEGLDYAHQKRDAGGSFLNLVHRDVSPQNLLVSYEGEVKVIDFGIAKAAGKAGKTQAGILKGKFGYMSPEQVLGMEIDRRSDVFGVGICLYELLTGERLFIAETDFATLEKVRNVDVMPPSTYNRKIPEELEQIVMRALARDREVRYQTAMELHDELQGFLYSSGSPAGRKELSAFMHRMFGEEIERENKRDQAYAALAVGEEESTANLRGKASVRPMQETRPSAGQAVAHGFDDEEPTEAFSSLSSSGANFPLPGRRNSEEPTAHFAEMSQGGEPFEEPTDDYGAGAAPAFAPMPRAQTLPPPVPQLSQPPAIKRPTLLGMPQGPQGPRVSAAPPPQVPPLYPTPQSIPPAHRPARTTPGLGMEWDDEEMSTQIYDKPEDLMAAMQGVVPQVSSGFGSSPQMPASGGYLTNPSAPPMDFGGAPALSNPSVPPSGNSMPAPSGMGGAVGAVPSTAPRARRQSAQTLTMEDNPFARPRGQQKGLLAVAGIVVGIVGLIVLGLVYFRGQRAPGMIELKTTPLDATVKLDGFTVSGQSPFLLQDVEPDKPHSLMVEKAGYKTWSTQVHLQAGQSIALPLVTLEAEHSGFSITSVPPGASVWIDGTETGRTTPAEFADLTPGNHVVRLTMDGHEAWTSTTLNVTAGTVLPLPPAVLQPEPSAQKQAPPVAHATKRSHSPSTPRAPRPRTTSPSPAPAPVASGTGYLRVNSRPWATVSVDGRVVGPTPQMRIEVPSGRHKLTLVNDEFGITKTLNVDVGPGETVTKVLTLTE